MSADGLPIQSTNPPPPSNPATAPQPMSERELAALAQLEIIDAIGNFGDEYLEARRDGLNQYLGNARGDEREGYSSVVTRDLLEEVEWAMPDLMEIFTAAAEIVEFHPEGPEDEPVATQRTDVCNYIFRKERGFMALYTLFKDALIQKLGAVKVFWDERPDATMEEYEGKNLFEVQLAAQDENIEFVAFEESGERGPEGEELFNFTLRRINNTGRIRIESVPPEELLVSRHVRNLDRPRFIAHRKVDMTESDLIDMGYDPEIVRNLPSAHTDLWNDTDQIIRSSREDTNYYNSSLREDSERTIIYTECYMAVDFDGDGVSEYRKVCVAGDGPVTLLHHEVVDDHPFAAVTPIPIPHRLIGLGLGDLVGDLQEVSTTLIRQGLQSMYLATNPRHRVLRGGGDEGGPLVDLDQLLDPTPGGFVEVDDVNALEPLVTQDVSAIAFEGLNRVREWREARTGITQMGTAHDANQIHATADGTNRLLGTKAKRLGLIARIFAETGVPRIFELMSKLLAQHSTKPLHYRLRNEWHVADPTEWKTRADARISVGLGHGSREEKVSNLTLVANLQKEAAQAGLPIVTPEHLYNTAKEITTAIGYTNPDKFWADPADAPLQPPEPDPAIEALKAQFAIDEMKVQIDREKLILEKAKAELQHERELRKMELEHDLKIRSLPQNQPGSAVNGAVA